MKTGGLRQTVLLCCALILATVGAGCAGRSAAESRLDEHKVTYYFDAELAFAIEHPAEWTLIRGKGEAPEACTVRWQSPPDQLRGEAPARAEVAACPGGDGSAGNAKLREDFLSAHPALVPTEDRAVELTGATGLMLVGADPMRTYLAAFLRSASRSYILTFSAPGQKFESYRPLFSEMLESFQPQQER